MTLGKMIAALLTVCVTAGWSAVGGRPAEVANGPAAKAAGDRAAVCGYRLSHVRRAGFLNVRSGPGLRFRPIGKLKVADGNISGSCRSTKRWVAVNSANGKAGWASADYLRTASTARASSYPTLACGYRLSHVRRAGYLNVRSGPGLRFRPVGKLRVADGRVSGSCGSSKRWVAVNSAKGKAGWSFAHYLHKVN